MWALGARPGTGPISLFNSMQRGMFRAKKPSRVQGRSRSVANWETWWAGLQRLNRRRDPHRTDYVGVLNFTEDAHAKVHPLSEFYRVVSQRPPGGRLLTTPIKSRKLPTPKLDGLLR